MHLYISQFRREEAKFAADVMDRLVGNTCFSLARVKALIGIFILACFTALLFPSPFRGLMVFDIVDPLNTVVQFLYQPP